MKFTTLVTGDAVPAFLAMPDHTVACRLDLGDRKADVGRFQLLQANDARPGLLQPAQEHRQALIDAVNVEGGGFSSSCLSS